ncbi:hypothetical protein Tco_0374011 [Tanacetum coccineum]
MNHAHRYGDPASKRGVPINHILIHGHQQVQGAAVEHSLNLLYTLMLRKQWRPGSGGSSADGNGNDVGTCGGKCSDDGNGNDVGTCGGKCSDDGGGGSDIPSNVRHGSGECGVRRLIVSNGSSSSEEGTWSTTGCKQAESARADAPPTSSSESLLLPPSTSCKGVIFHRRYLHQLDMSMDHPKSLHGIHLVNSSHNIWPRTWVDYPADGGDGDDDDSFDDDEEEEEAFEEEEEEHLALADSVVAPVVDHVPSSEETEPFETDESAATPPSPPACRTTARISIRPEAPMPFPSEEEVERLLALPPPPSPLISLSHPLQRNTLLSFRAAMGRLRASSPSTHHPLHLSLPLPPPPSSLHLPPHVPTSLPLPSSLHLPPHVLTSLPLPSSLLPPLPASLFIPPPVDHREYTPEAELPPCNKLCLTTLTSRYKVRESSTAAPRPAGGHGIDYGFIGTLDAKTRRQRAEEVGYGIRDTSVDPREAHSMGLSSAIHYELPGYKTHAWMQDHRIDAHDSLIAALTAQVSSLQGHLAMTLSDIRALQARD